MENGIALLCPNYSIQSIDDHCHFKQSFSESNHYIIVSDIACEIHAFWQNDPFSGYPAVQMIYTPSLVLSHQFLLTWSQLYSSLYILTLTLTNGWHLKAFSIQLSELTRRYIIQNYYNLAVCTWTLHGLLLYLSLHCIPGLFWFGRRQLTVCNQQGCKALTMAHILKEINVACLRAPEIVQNYAMLLMDLSSTLCLVRPSEMAV